MELLSPVEIVRDSIATIVQILADRDIPVRQEGMKAAVSYNEITGEPIAVTLPYLPDDASEDLILSVQGFLDHEVGHLLFTDQSELIKIAHDPQLLEMQNVIEDPYVERKMRERFPGSRNNLNQLYQLFIERIVHKNYEALVARGEVNPMAYFGVLFPVISRAWADFPDFKEYMDDKWELVEPIVKKIDTKLIERMPFTKNTAENVEIGREMLLQIMMDPYDDLDSGDDDECEMPSKGKMGDPRKSAKSKSSGEGGRRSGRSIVDEEGDDTDEKPEPEEETEEESYDDHDEYDDRFDDEGEEDEDEGGSGAASDDEDEDDGLEGGEDEEDKALEGGTSAELEKDKVEEESGDDIDAGDGAFSDDGEDDEDDDEGEVWRPSSDKEFLEHSIGDLDDSMGGEIEKMASDAAERSDYVIPTTDQDVIEPAPIVCELREAERRVKALDERVMDVASAIQLDFERAFVSQQKSYWRGGQTRGAINASQLARIRTGDMRVFRQREVRKTRDFDVQMVIDCSGSMNGERMKLAIEAAYSMGVALDRIGINFEIIGFTSKMGVSLGSRGVAGRKYRYSRLDAIYMPVFKDFKEIWSPTVMQRLASWSQPSRGVLQQNVDGESLMLAAKRLAAQASPGKAMIVLSDGSPCCHSEDDAALSRHLKKTTKTIENAGINLVGIGIQHEGVREYFSNYTVLRNLSSLPTTAVTQVRDIILGM